MKETAKSTKFNKRKWLIANTLGWLLGFILVLILVIALDSMGIEGIDFFVALAMSLAVGTAQYLVLSKAITLTKKWIFYTAFGLTSPFVFYEILRFLEIISLGAWFLPICITAGSILVGIGQAKLLSEHGIDKNGWLGITILAWVLVAISVAMLDLTMHYIPNPLIGFILNLVFLLAGGSIIGLITGNYLDKNLKDRMVEK